MLAGTRLRNLPLIRREWDSEHPANRRLDPDTVTTGHDKFRVGWVCHEDPTHRWEQTINQRCGRLQGCPKCRYLPAKDPPSSRSLLAAVRAGWGDYESAQGTPATGGLRAG
jgi:Probable Zinc-ribbon domain